MFEAMPLTLTLAQDEPAPVLPDDTPAPTETQPGEAANGEPAGQQQPAASPDWTLPLIFILLLVVLWVFLMGGQRREKKRRAAMLESLNKGDRIQTVGGILGTIVEMRDDELVVKVDENTNTRLRFSRSAVQSVLNKQEE